MKKLYLILPIILVVLTAVPVYAVGFEQNHPQRLVDEADIVDDFDEISLTEMLDKVSEEYECDVVIVTTDSLGMKSATAYADDYFDYNGYGYGDDYTGILFLISMGEREWAFSTCGGAISIFDDYRLMQMEDKIIPYLSDGDYYEAFECYADLCETYLKSGASDVIYDDYGGYDPYYDYYYDDYYTSTPYSSSANYNLVIPALGSVAAGFVLALIIVNVMKGELNTVKMQSGAANYIKNGSFRITTQRDIFLYRKVTKVVRETDNHSNGGSHRSGGSSVHSSSSGRSHGGRSGRF